MINMIIIIVIKMFILITIIIIIFIILILYEKNDKLYVKLSTFTIIINLIFFYENFIFEDFAFLLIKEEINPYEAALLLIVNPLIIKEGSFLLWVMTFEILLLSYQFFYFLQSTNTKSLIFKFQHLWLFIFICGIIYNPIDILYLEKYELRTAQILKFFDADFKNIYFYLHPILLYISYLFAGINLLLFCEFSFFKKNYRRNDKYLNILTSYNFFLLSFAIFLGMLWSYNQLGWGGLWVWDPIENLSLLVWILLLFVIHKQQTLYSPKLKYLTYSFRKNNIYIYLIIYIYVILMYFLFKTGFFDSMHSFIGNFANYKFIYLIFLISLFYLVLIYIIQKSKLLEFDIFFSNVIRKNIKILIYSVFSCVIISFFIIVFSNTFRLDYVKKLLTILNFTDLDITSICFFFLTFFLYILYAIQNKKSFLSLSDRFHYSIYICIIFFIFMINIIKTETTLFLSLAFTQILMGFSKTFQNFYKIENSMQLNEIFFMSKKSVFFDIKNISIKHVLLIRLKDYVLTKFRLRGNIIVIKTMLYPLYRISSIFSYDDFFSLQKKLCFNFKLINNDRLLWQDIKQYSIQSYIKNNDSNIIIKKFNHQILRTFNFLNFIEAFVYKGSPHATLRYCKGFLITENFIIKKDYILFRQNYKKIKSLVSNEILNISINNNILNKIIFNLQSFKLKTLVIQDPDLIEKLKLIENQKIKKLKKNIISEIMVSTTILLDFYYQFNIIIITPFLVEYTIILFPSFFFFTIFFFYMIFFFFKSKKFYIFQKII